MKLSSPEGRVYYTLRIASGFCFIGHGAFGIITKKIWLNYFAVFGIGPALGHQLMPRLGLVDILMGLSLLIYLLRGILLWLAIWGAITALLRPLSGEPFAEAIERAGNFVAPMALLIWSGSGYDSKTWFKRLSIPNQVSQVNLSRTVVALRSAVFLMFAGHGWLALIGKQGLIDQYAAIGFANPKQVAHIMGMLEVFAAVTIWIRPAGPILFLLLIWKMGTELFYPHWEAFEWIERAGSYGCILALLMLIPVRKAKFA